MPLIKASMKPGINREIPEYANEGGYDYSNLIRFRGGYAEKLGGWANTNYAANPSSPSSYTFNGVLRSILSWVTSAGNNLLGFGTTQQYYAQNGVGNPYNDISPTAYTANLYGSSFSTVETGTPLIKVSNATSSIMTPTIPNAGLDVGSIVYFYASTLQSRLYQVAHSPNTNPVIPATAPAGITQVGGSAILVGGTTPTFIVNGVTINANPPAYYNTRNSLATGYPVVSVDRETITNVTATPGTPTGPVSGVYTYTVTLTGTSLSGVIPLAGVSIFLMNLGVFNGNRTVATASWAGQVLTVTFTYTSTSSSLSTSFSGTFTWVDSFQIIGSGSASTTGIDSTVTALPVAMTALPNFGNSTNVYTTSGAVAYTERTWSQASFGDDLIFAIQGGPLYYWVKDTYSWAPAITLAAYANTQQYQQVNVTGTVVSSLTFTVDFNDYVFPGQTISLASGTAALLTTGTKVVSISGLTVTVDQAVSITSGAVLNLSYSGQFVPTRTNKLFFSPVYQCVIALGANPYDPFNPDTAFNPLLVRWSDQANPYEWIPQASNQAGEQPLGYGSKLVTAVTNLQAILVFTDTAVYQMQYVGAPFTFSFSLLQDNISIISQNAVITANNTTWWMGTDKFYVFNGSTQVLPCTIRRFVFSNIERSQAWQIVAGYNEGFNEVWWFYPSTGSTVNDSYVKYNFSENLWDYGSLNRTAWLGRGTLPYPVAAINVQSTYLTAAATSSSSETTFSVADASSFPLSGVLKVGTELVVYSRTNATTLTVARSSAVNRAAHSKYTSVALATPNQLAYHEYGIDDNTVTGITLPVQGFIQTSDFGVAEGNSLVSVNRIIPDLTFVNSTGAAPVITTTVYPRVNPGSAYQTPPASGVDQPTITSTVLPSETTPLPEQYTGQPNKTTALLTAGQGEIYTRVRGRTIAIRFDTGDTTNSVAVAGYPVQVPSGSVGTMWQLGLFRIDVRPDGRR